MSYNTCYCFLVIVYFEFESEEFILHVGTLYVMSVINVVTIPTFFTLQEIQSDVYVQ